MTEKVRVGIIGAGWVAAARHAPAFKRDSRASLYAVFDDDADRTESFARRFQIPRRCVSLDALLQEPIKAVAICTPPWTHAALIEAALAAGRHVLVEKPLTLKSEEGRYLEKLAIDRGLVFCPAHNFLFSRSARKAAALLRSGQAGEVRSAMGLQVSSHRRRLPTWYERLPGGLFFDEAPHLLYLMRSFMGDLQVGHAWNSGGRIEARLQGSQGEAYLTMWSGAPFSEWLFILFCTRAVLVLDLFRDILIRLPEERGHRALDVLKSSAAGTRQLWSGIAASAWHSIRGTQLYGHDILVRRFLDSIIGGAETPVTGRQGWEVVALIEDILSRSSQR